MDLFDYMREQDMANDAPLASRMRPKTLDEVVGQQHIVGKDKLLYRAISTDKLSSVIFYGPPGTGKTTLAKVIANTTKAGFMQINATTSGKKDMEDVVAKAKEERGMHGRKTILFIDEIHRFNKSQQDYLLPFVEDGTIILIGATTENPFFEVNKALISRSILFELKPLEPADIRELLVRALEDEINGMKSYMVHVEEEALDFLSTVTDGDARAALNALELGVLSTQRNADGMIEVDLNVVKECVQKKMVPYDRDGDAHYDNISAFIKSMRGSDPDAAVYYLAKMLYAGEDIKFIARRMMIHAAEDVGLADPMALVVATNASLAVERVGMPEAQLILTEAALYIATAPKSDSCTRAIGRASELVRDEKKGFFDIPAHLKDAHYRDASRLGHGEGYLYSHDYPNHYVKQQYLPDELQGTVFYEPSGNGKEKEIAEWFEFLKKQTR